jgi:hypothetical protein
VQPALSCVTRAELGTGEWTAELALVAPQLALTHEAMVWVTMLKHRRGTCADHQVTGTGGRDAAWVDTASSADAQTLSRDRE